MAPETCTYYGTFTPGLEGTVAEILGERFPGIAIPLRLSGALVFKSPVSYDRLNLPCFNNVFRLIDTAADMNSTGNSRPEQTLTAFARRTLGRGAERLAFSGPGREPESKKAQGRTAGFRVIFSLENKLIAVDEELRRMVENRLAALSGLRVNRGRPGVEFWFLLRREGAFFLRRLSRHRPWDKLLHPGELPPPLAWMLCRLSNPGPGQRVADPFCGYGSIPAARLRHFPPAEFFASDMDRGVLKIAQAKFQGKPQHRCHFACIDAGELPRLIPPASLDSIITDPPWGLYQKSGPGTETAEKDRRGAKGGRTGEQGSPRLPPGELYSQSLAVFSGLLKPGAPAVVLCGRGEELKGAAEKNGFSVVKNIPILLSGRKAAVYVLRSPE